MLVWPLARTRRNSLLDRHLRAVLRGQKTLRRGGRVVMQRTATPLTPVRFRPAPPIYPHHAVLAISLPGGTCFFWDLQFFAKFIIFLPGSRSLYRADESFIGLTIPLPGLTDSPATAVCAAVREALGCRLAAINIPRPARMVMLASDCE